MFSMICSRSVSECIIHPPSFRRRSWKICKWTRSDFLPTDSQCPHAWCVLPINPAGWAGRSSSQVVFSDDPLFFASAWTEGPSVFLVLVNMWRFVSSGMNAESLTMYADTFRWWRTNENCYCKFKCFKGTSLMPCNLWWKKPHMNKMSCSWGIINDLTLAKLHFMSVEPHSCYQYVHLFDDLFTQWSL